MLRIANALVALGHHVDVYTMSWEGAMPENGIHVRLVRGKGMLNHQRYEYFIRSAQQQINAYVYDLVVGFNKTAGLHAYFAADPCFIERAHEERGFLYRLSGRYRWFEKCERAVFHAKSDCQILLLSDKEKPIFQKWYKTQVDRFHLLPPFLSRERMVLQDKAEMRSRLRQEFGFRPQDNVLLMVGSGFRTKGLDRAINALAALPHKMRLQTRLLAVGQDNPKAFNRLAADCGMQDQVVISGGRNDIPQLMQGADLYIHPARRELAGHALLEAMASGLPVLVTDVCGYACHIEEADAGVVMHGIFSQGALNQHLQDMLASSKRGAWSENGLKYAAEIMERNDGNAEATILADLAVKRRLEMRNDHGLVL